MNVVLGLAAVLVLTAATGYFVAQEFAYVTADRLALDHQAKDGDRRAARAVRVMERLSFMLSGAQLGITVTALVVGFIAKPALADLIAPPLRAFGVPDAAVGGIAVATGFALATIIQMVLGELFPKNLALARAEVLARALASSTLIYLTLAAPLIKLFDASANRLLRSVGIEPVEELHHGATLEELGHIIGESGEHLEAGHTELLERALAFSERTADEVMVPRVDVVTVPASAMASELSDVIAAHGHTRYPIVGESIDDVVGTIGLDELIRLTPEESGRTPVRGLAQPALLVPGTLPLPDLVTQLRTDGGAMACVIDEYGGFAGVLTWEDLAEELVGEIADENDVEEDLAVRRGEWWTTDAGLRVDEVAHETGIALPEGDYETVAGLILKQLGRIAEPGDRVTVDVPPQHLDDPPRQATIEVLNIHRHVPEMIRIRSVERDLGHSEGGNR
ncbi:hemolysin family protein [Actinomadura rudentiformis]|uniref:HlyC/CorC family transporter n=1 Tax=Actinomadura rudentiformis TaxID=359158 RepID=A0A6H9YBH7_9ACTN|nr:hemolysin family protein [Actinomadura rudentiformis]KAB2342638.1 HlyC/CorC family transporter [Actinomadura rudentiformis]